MNACVMNQLEGHWILSDVLIATTSISFNMEIKVIQDLVIGLKLWMKLI
jgi:hypothetical protein